MPRGEMRQPGMEFDRSSRVRLQLSFITSETPGSETDERRDDHGVAPESAVEKRVSALAVLSGTTSHGRSNSSCSGIGNRILPRADLSDWYPSVRDQPVQADTRFAQSHSLSTGNSLHDPLCHYASR